MITSLFYAQTADEAVCLCVCYRSIVCVPAQQAQEDFFHTPSNNITGLMNPLGLTHNMRQCSVITLHDSANKAPLLICRFQGQGDVFVRVFVCICESYKTECHDLDSQLKQYATKTP